MFHPFFPRIVQRFGRSGPARRPLEARKLLLLALTATLFASCSKGGGPIAGPPVSPPAPRTLYVPDSVQTIFNENCAYSGCHAGSRPEAGLDLSAAHAYASLVDIPSVSCAPLFRIRPGKPDSSCIVDRLMGDVEPMMPLAGWIPADSRMIVVHWIAAGAPGVDDRSSLASTAARAGQP